MTRRSRARETALQILYQDDLNPGLDPSAAGQFVASHSGESEPGRLAEQLVHGVLQHRSELDSRLGDAAEHWSLERMAAIDRNVLRLGAYELLYTETPDRVAVDEAIELAKKYGSGQSAAFVNGILDRLMHAADRAPAPSQQSAEAPPENAQSMPTDRPPG